MSETKLPNLIKKFTGYGNPKYTPIPDLFLDDQMQDLTEAELKVILYIFRRTFGFKKEQDAISYDQFLNGITRQDGSLLDRGTGISETSLRTALKSLVERGYIFKHSSADERGVKRTNIYELNIHGAPHFHGGDTPNSAPPLPQILPDSTANLALPLASTGPANSADTIKQFKQKTVNQHTAVCADLENELILNGISPTTAKRLALDTLKAGRNKAHLTAWLTWISAQPNIQNPTAYLIQMIRDNADPPSPTKPTENRLDKLKSSLEKYGLYQPPAAPAQSAEERAEATRRRVMEAAYRTQNGENYQ